MKSAQAAAASAEAAAQAQAAEEAAEEAQAKAEAALAAAEEAARTSAENTEAARKAKEAAEAAQAEAEAAVQAAQLAAEGLKPDVIVLDPPRKGCEASLFDTIAEMAPKKVVMISCNSATAARDCAKLAEVGYVPTKMRAVDMFPRTGHVESVVCLTRK